MKRTRRAPTRALRETRPKPPSPNRTTSGPCDARSDVDTPVESFVRAMAAELGLDDDTPADYRTRRQLLRLSLWATGEGFALNREVILDPVRSNASPRWFLPLTARERPIGRCCGESDLF